MVSTSFPEISLLIIEDQPPIVSGVISMLGNKGYIIHSAQSLEEGRNVLASEDIDIMLLDLVLQPEKDPSKALPFLSEVKENYPRVVSVIYSTNVNLRINAVREALKEGVSYIIKETTPEDKLDDVIRISLTGSVVYSESVVAYFEQLLSEKDKPLLTPGELRIAELIAKDKSNKLIALETGKKESRVREQVTNILRKLQKDSRTGVAIWFKETYPDGLPDVED